MSAPGLRARRARPLLWLLALPPTLLGCEDLPPPPPPAPIEVPLPAAEPAPAPAEAAPAAMQAPEPVPDLLAGFRAGVSADGLRLAYLSRAPRAPAPLLTVVTLPDGLRVTDFLVDDAEARARGRRLLEAGGYVEAGASLPEGMTLQLTRTDEGWWATRQDAKGRRAIAVGEHFARTLAAFPRPALRLHGLTPDGRFALYEVRDAADPEAPWPRSMIALSLR